MLWTVAAKDDLFQVVAVDDCACAIRMLLRRQSVSRKEVVVLPVRPFLFCEVADPWDYSWAVDCAHFRPCFLLFIWSCYTLHPCRIKVGFWHRNFDHFPGQCVKFEGSKYITFLACQIVQCVTTHTHTIKHYVIVWYSQLTDLKILCWCQTIMCSFQA